MTDGRLDPQPTWPVREHHHREGIVRQAPDGRRYLARGLNGAVSHSHPVAPDRYSHTHQVCPHSPAHAQYFCPSPVGAYGPGSPPLSFSRDELPQPTLELPGEQNVRVWSEEGHQPRGAQLDPRWLRRQREARRRH